MLKKIIAVLLITLPLSATAGKLLNCDQINTSQGIRYVGTYCMDYKCTYVKRIIFSRWCPYSV